MKNVFKLAAIAAAFTFPATLANANDKIAFADPNFLLQNHPEMVIASQKIEKAVQEAKNKFADEEKKLTEEDKALSDEFQKIEEDAQKLKKEQDALEASLKKKVAALDKDAPRLRSKEIQARQNAIQNEQKTFQKKVDAIQKREADFRKKADAFQDKVAQFQQKLEQEQNAMNIDTTEIQKKAVEDVNVAIKAVAESKGYTLVLIPSVALYAKDETANITEEVLSSLKANVKVAEEKPAEQAK
ncbi:hypothetical protein A1D29_05580 [Pasteurellaceae bacterium Orientalotternb1]|nr:hypothetical protein A1D29_05580 [Pasteurellaceae bacterium Orientalotternb1]